MANAPSTSVEFENPPVVETIFGVQFPPLAFTTGHYGWFWKSKLGEEWSKAMDAPPLQDQFERFGDEAWSSPAIQFGVLPPGIARLQLSNKDNDRIIQIQNTRFLFNWRKRQKAYPSYTKTKADFFQLYSKFSDFIRDIELGKIAPNQWEMSYVDHIPKGNLWQSAEDWHKIIPGLLANGPKIQGLKFENVGEWQFEIMPKKGRLYITLQHGRISPNSNEVLVLHWTARGPLNDGTNTLEEAMDLGHETIKKAFLEITSLEAQQAWGIKKLCPI